MLHARSNRRRLVAAVTTVLAVTLGAGALTVPATAAAATPTASTAEATATPFAFPKNSRLIDAGVRNFLTQTVGSSTRRYAKYGDDIGYGTGGRSQIGSTRTDDYLVFVDHYKVTIRDMTRVTQQREIFVDALTGSPKYAGSAANAAFTMVGPDLMKHTIGSSAPVAGLPDGATSVAISQGTADDALVRFTVAGVVKWGLLNLATDTVEEIPGVPAGAEVKAVSATHVAWTTGAGTTTPAVFRLNRATDAVEEIPVADAVSNDLKVSLVGGWVLYGEANGFSAQEPNPLHALTAYNPDAEGEKTLKLLDDLTSAATAGDGSVRVRGGSLAQGEGMYKITATANEAPAVVLEATTGEATQLAVTGNDVTPAVDLDKNAGTAKFTWNLSRANAEVKLTLRHTRTGKTETYYDYPTQASTSFDWRGEYNGAYTWELTATPLNGIGSPATATGGFTATRTPKPHDFDDNGAPDLLLRDGAGRLWRADTSYGTQLQADPHQLIGTGWQVYDRIEATGDIAGSNVGDLIAREPSGALWLYQGNGTGGFGGRTKIGTGWQTFTQIAGGSDLNGDGRADLVAVDKAGDLYMYPGTGSSNSPFGARKKIGTGWGIYNQLTAVGNVAGGVAGDLYARDASGVLWQYLGKGDGTFAARTKVGGGWNTYQHLVGVGDANRDGRPDLVGFGATSQYLYRGTGNWQAPLLGAQLAGLTFGGGPYNTIA